MSQLARVYRVEVISAALVAGASALLGSLVLMGLISPALGDPPAVLMVAIAICAVFFALNLALRALAGKPVAFPFPAAAQRTAAIAATTTFVAVLGYGFFRWSAAPLRARKGGFVDKLGRPCSFEQFLAFKRWETAFVFFALATLLVALTDIPAKGFRVARPDAADDARQA